eukprot:gb/GEZN01021301.1/.p1 GENE.gb/GEZN01021301.1/~~gb/GEZN01021301.1/.p1  ORF type:complete len:147 (+),score=27.31 gb/GEZN01021301.1/:47-442(+)
MAESTPPPVLHGHEDLIGVCDLAGAAAKYQERKIAPNFSKYLKRVPGGPLVAAKQQGQEKSEFSSAITPLIHPAEPPIIYEIQPLPSDVFPANFTFTSSAPLGLLQDHDKDKTKKKKHKRKHSADQRDDGT